LKLKGCFQFDLMGWIQQLTLLLGLLLAGTPCSYLLWGRENWRKSMVWAQQCNTGVSCDVIGA
jgi:hypothetical protein